MQKIYCSNCGKLKELQNKRYCRECSSAYIREWRKTHPLTEEQKFKANVRNKTKMKVQRGSIIKQPCEVCGEMKSEAHHKDYNNPYDFQWLCFKHHREIHKKNKIKKISLPEKKSPLSKNHEYKAKGYNFVF
jgi:hypothetical protein